MDVKQRQEIERKIASETVQLLLEYKFKISVFDSEEMVLHKSQNATAVLNAMFSTDEDVLYVYNDEKPSGRFIQFVYGNDGYDVIADYNSSLEGILKPIAELSACLEAEWG